MQHRAAEVAVHMGMVGVYEIGASAMGSAVAAGAVAVGVTGARVVNAGLLRWAAPSHADVTAVTRVKRVGEAGGQRSGRAVVTRA